MAAVCEWIVRGGEQARYWESEVTIPCPLIAEIDDSDPQDVRVWDNFWEFSYATRGTTLFCVSGGERPGLLHLRAADGGYEVFNEEMVGDGEAYAKDMRRIFGSIRMIKLDALDREEVRTQYIADYVLQNGLPFTQYQDYGWDTVHIPGTPESAQLLRYVDPMGWGIDYDLREFLLDRDSDMEAVLSGVGNLKGISIIFERYAGTTAEAVIAILAEQMEQPTEKSATLGANSIPATLLRDGVTREEVIKDTYVLALNETDALAVTVRNTYYAENGDPIVQGGREALEKALATFRLTATPSRNTAEEAHDAERQKFASGKAESLDEINLLYTWADIRAASEPVEQPTHNVEPGSMKKGVEEYGMPVDETLPTGERIVLFHPINIDYTDMKYWAVDRGDNWEVFCMEDAAYQDGYSVSTYENVLGHNGFCICGPRGAGYSFRDYYYFDENGAIQYLADGSNLVIETDLNGDGTKEILYLYHYWAVCEFLNDETVYRCYLPGLLDNIDGWSWHGFDGGRDAETQVLEKRILPITLHLTNDQNVSRNAELLFSAQGITLSTGTD